MDPLSLFQRGRGKTAMQVWPGLLLLAAVSCAPPARPTLADPPLSGSWQSDDALARFDARKCYLYEKGRLEVFAAAYRPGQLVLSSWGRTFTWEVKQEGDVLSLRSTDGAHQLRFRRLPETPAELTVRAMPLPPAGPVPPDRVREIVAELGRRKVADQAVRLDPAMRPQQAPVDADNTAYLLRLIQEVGWIDAGRFGRDAAGAAFLIAQHAGDLSLLLAILPLVEADARAGRVDASHYASMYDRVQVMQAEPQRYGTQLGQNDKGEMVVLPLQDRARVEEFRKDLGLPPLTVYLEYLRQKHGWTIRFADP